MSVLAPIHNRFFAFRSMSPTRRCTTSGSGPHHRRERRCRQFLDSAFSVQQRAQRLALTGAAIDVATPSCNSSEQRVGRTSGLDGILYAVVGGAGSDPAVFDRLRGQWSDDVAMDRVRAEGGAQVALQPTNSTTVFHFANNAITGSPVQVKVATAPSGFGQGTFSQGAFANGNVIMGIGLKMKDNDASAIGTTFLNFGIGTHNYRAASSLGGTDGRTDNTVWARTGDFGMWMSAPAGGSGPSNLYAMTTNGAAYAGTGQYSNLPGRFWKWRQLRLCRSDIPPGWCRRIDSVPL